MFTLLFLASAAVPVLAQTEESLDSPMSADGSARVPDPEAITRALREARAEEDAKAEDLESQQASREREESRRAFTDLSAEDAQGLLRALFAKQLDALDNDPARLLTDARLLDAYGDDGAVIEDDGERLLLDGNVPIRTRDDLNELRKVDLTLESTGKGLEPANPVTDVLIPSTAGEPVRKLGADGLSIDALGGTGDRTARIFEGKGVFYPEVHEDSDRLVAPTTTGVEFFDLLRSVESPETFRYKIDLPAGATLRAAGGGAEVVTDGEVTTRVRPPVATDAQGSDVPVTMQVEGDTLVIQVPHREMELAYPALVDPIFEWEIREDWYNDNWYNGWNLDDLNEWDWYTNSNWIYGSTHPIYRHFGGHGRGLHVSSKSADFGPGRWGHWAYDLPNLNAYVEAISVLPFWYDTHGCAKYYHPLPEDYVGLWDIVNEKWNKLRHNDAYFNGYSNVGFPNENPGWGHMVMIGLTMGWGPDIPCWRDFYAGGALVYLSDWADPTMNYFNGAPSGWIGADTPVTFAGEAFDAGLGVKEIVFDPAGSVGQFNMKHACNGLAGNRCPPVFAAQKNITGKSLDEGKRLVTTTAQDALKRPSTAKTIYTKVDRTPPKVTLSGQLAQATNEGGSEEKPAGEGDELTLPVYRLNIEATDGSNAEDKLRRSGVKDIEIRLDGVEQEVPWSAQSCPNDSCAMNKTYELKLYDVEPGEHLLEIDVEDHVGETRERNIEFEYFPATGMKDEYVMHYFPLPDGQGNEEEEELPARPELAVNVMNGNLVYREKDVDVEGAAVDLEVERYYNSMLPEEENTEWGDGWTLAQTPKLEAESPSVGRMVKASGAMQSGVSFAGESGQSAFDSQLQATITTLTGGGHELTDETGESPGSLVFDSSGKVSELSTEGYAKVDYGYEGGELAEIAVDDPGSAGSPTEEPEEEGSGSSGETPTFSDAFGELGSGDGQLNRPADLAMDASGHLWVVDKSNNRVHEFDAEGNFLSKFGSYGTGNGQFNRPASIVIDSVGDLWITDANNNRVQKFDDEGNFLAKFGSGGSGNGQFSGPEGIAIDAEGNLWVSDTYNGRVQKFNPQGEFLQVVGSYGSGEGQIGEATGIDIDSAGNVWIADWQNNRVSVFDSAGEFLDSFGSQGTGDGQFNRPDAIDVDASGNVWVGDQNNDRIQRFDLAGQYIDQFGSTGSGEGQFDFTWPMGLFADDNGQVWVSDTLNHRVQRWSIPEQTTLHLEHAGALGSSGSEQGQFEAPSDIAVGPDGDLWVADTANDRIQHFDAQGAFLSQFGSTGSEDGQLSEPTGVALDAEGNVWVVDRGNHRLQRFSPEGEFLSKFGELGFGEGKLAAPGQLAIDAAGDLLITDYFRLQRFSPSGEFVELIGSGQISQPTGLDIGPEGTIWVASSGNDKVFAFDEAGGLIAQFGSSGAGEGQFEQPIDVALGAQGNLWVADAQLDRVQLLDKTGDYIGQLGETGAGEGQLNLANPSGIAADAGGNLWIADRGNDRIQQWLGFTYAQSGEEATPEEDDPKVEIETPEGLVSSVSGEEAGEHSYAHEGELLTAVAGPDGETSYEYDEEGRLTKVTLSNGTWGQIAYNATYGRVKSVTVDPAGEEPAKTTDFEFEDEPHRRTYVTPPDAPQVIYEIGADGSVLKWWNKNEPPVFDDLSGTLYDSKETSSPIEHGDHTLNTQAFSAHGIASIEVIADNDTLVDEMTCEQDPEEPGIECEEVINQWVTETDLHSPGRLYLEVVITDRIGNSASERFWVRIPPPPPPPAPGAAEPPTFFEIKEFREEYGLEVVFPVANEIELHERIFELMGAWYNGHSAEGKVARASMDRWGVPLRPQDVAELEYREWYNEVNGSRIEDWAYTHAASTYAGYELDHRAGGLLRVGFTEDQVDMLDDLIASVGLVARDRLDVYSSLPSKARLSLEELEPAVAAATEEDVTLSEVATEVGVGDAQNALVVTATNVSLAAQRLQQLFGSSIANIDVEQATSVPEPTTRNRATGRMFAGDRIITQWADGVRSQCTAGFGAYEDRYVPKRRQPLRARFLLSAGHCGNVTQPIFRSASSSASVYDIPLPAWHHIGNANRNLLGIAPRFHDAMAIRLGSTGLALRRLYGRGSNRPPVKGARIARRGQRLCYSGSKSNRVKCGNIIGIKHVYVRDFHRKVGYLKVSALHTMKGDSGAPVWRAADGASIGILSAKSGSHGLVQALRNTPTGRNTVVGGVYDAPAIGKLHTIVGH